MNAFTLDRPKPTRGSYRAHGIELTCAFYNLSAVSPSPVDVLLQKIRERLAKDDIR